MAKFQVPTTASKTWSIAVNSLLPGGICEFWAAFDDFGIQFENSPVFIPCSFVGTNGGSALGSNFFREVYDLRWMASATVRQISGKSNSDATDIEGIGCQRLLPSAHIATPTG